MTANGTRRGADCRRATLPASALLLGLLAGCAGDAWPLAPAGPQADRIATLWWLFLTVAAGTWVTVLGVAAWAVMRGRRRSEPASDAGTTRRQARAVVAAAAVTLVLLFTLALVDYGTVRRMGEQPDASPPLTILVTGHRWWWELTYEDTDPERRFTSANEIHIPVGVPVLLKVTSRDVIHSLWIPRLQGKRDLIPGYTNSLWIQADEPGIYRGGCAEFCGLQHARMRLEVIAEPPERFEAWYRNQLRPAAQPADAGSLRGRDVFVTGRCALCHTIRGTPARGRVGPDLTHLGTRRTLAAGILPNTRGHLGGWIVDPQALKRGTPMPRNPLPGEDLQALLAYLEGLR